MDMIFKIHNLFLNKVYAQGLGEELEKRIAKLEDGDMDKESFVSAIANIAVPAAILCLIVLVVYAGYMLIASRGEPEKIKEGKEVLTNAIIGFFIVVLSVVILLLISNSLDLEIYS
jgi:hypothetical protein